MIQFEIHFDVDFYCEQTKPKQVKLRIDWSIKHDKLQSVILSGVW